MKKVVQPEAQTASIDEACLAQFIGMENHAGRFIYVQRSPMEHCFLRLSQLTGTQCWCERISRKALFVHALSDNYELFVFDSLTELAQWLEKS